MNVRSGSTHHFSAIVWGLLGCWGVACSSGSGHAGGAAAEVAQPVVEEPKGAREEVVVARDEAEAAPDEADAAEEASASSVVSPKPKASPSALVYGRDFAFVIDAPTPHVVLAVDVNKRWRSGKPTLDDDVRVRNEVDPARLPQAIRTMLGRALVVYGTAAEGTPSVVGTATLGEPHVLAELRGQFGDEAIEDLRALIADGDVIEPKRRRDTKRAITDMGRTILVAPLHGDVPTGASWARDASLEAPEFFVERRLKPQQVRAMTEALLATKKGALAAETYAFYNDGAALRDVLRTQGWSNARGALVLATTLMAADSQWSDGWCFGNDSIVSTSARIVDTAVQPSFVLSAEHIDKPALVADFNADGFPDVVLGGDLLDTGHGIYVGGPGGHVELLRVAAVPSEHGDC